MVEVTNGDDAASGSAAVWRNAGPGPQSKAISITTVMVATGLSHHASAFTFRSGGLKSIRWALWNLVSGHRRTLSPCLPRRLRTAFLTLWTAVASYWGWIVAAMNSLLPLSAMVPRSPLPPP